MRLLILLSILLPMLALSDTTTSYDRISLAVSASDDINNDTLVVVMYLQREGSNTGQLAREVNGGISEAIAQARQHPNIQLQTLDYNTTPVYHKQRLSGWRVRQSLRLESQDSTQLSQLTGQLQNLLQLERIHYQLSAGQRQQAEQRLISQALSQFKTRAGLVSEQLQATGYQLVEMNISTSSNMPRPFAMRAMAAGMQAESGPQIEAGTQQVTVNINGTIELTK